jgi:atypical dual specificity phosphatase
MDPSAFRYASLITPQLYLSDYWTAQNEAKLEELGITHVVSLLFTGAPQLPEFIFTDRRLYIHIKDREDSDILQHLDTTTAFITKAITEDPTNKVLVSSFSLNIDISQVL